ncbi:hypothetical protein J2S70_000696 [Trueperella bonasi]|uniref:Uncharacterized protein n=1 Tax=Trueperella bonasi TaxID=312286 RepID=A0ABT9NFK7_9ACTO|nr:hypothetical protein [Trueperella bonasi]
MLGGEAANSGLAPSLAPDRMRGLKSKVVWGAIFGERVRKMVPLVMGAGYNG